LLILYVWRSINSSWFLFLQVISGSLILYFSLLVSSGRFNFFRGKELVATLMAFIIVAVLFLNIDRSRSFYLLKWVNQYSVNGFATLETILVTKGFDDVQAQALKQRLKEQAESATLSVEGEKIRLTVLGRIIVSISNFFAGVFRLNGYINS
jgi:hypothetical protein